VRRACPLRGGPSSARSRSPASLIAPRASPRGCGPSPRARTRPPGSTATSPRAGPSSLARSSSFPARRHLVGATYANAWPTPARGSFFAQVSRAAPGVPARPRAIRDESARVRYLAPLAAVRIEARFTLVALVAFAAACSHGAAPSAADAGPAALADTGPSMDPEAIEAAHRRALVEKAHEVYAA